MTGVTELEQARRAFKHENPDLYYLIRDHVAAQTAADLADYFERQGMLHGARLLYDRRAVYRKQYLDRAAPKGE